MKVEGRSPTPTSARANSQRLSISTNEVQPVTRKQTRKLSQLTTPRSTTPTGEASPQGLVRKGTRQLTARSNAGGAEVARTLSRKNTRQLTQTGGGSPRLPEESAISLRSRTVAERLANQTTKFASFELERFWHSGYYLPQLEPVMAEDDSLHEHFMRLLEARNLKQMEMFLHAGYSPNLSINEFEQTALHKAAEEGDEVLCSLLLRFQADPTKQDQSRSVTGEGAGKTALQLADQNGHSHIVHLLNIHFHKLN
eukprot:CAMPEP_0178397226 /NCGR_PEP_ID=MMETSP0689_2-20121128/14135_1 /TAXON_ID=160604 /ORGANISM="Amphidinium massartii, Strain CS-259" /LENGTH=253 /DNA_ID=CAMNT_0020017925 /DNA_START=19 /DNA_END=777 /DNA_ORIENTATION=+